MGSVLEAGDAPLKFLYLSTDPSRVYLMQPEINAWYEFDADSLEEISQFEIAVESENVDSQADTTMEILYVDPTAHTAWLCSETDGVAIVDLAGGRMLSIYYPAGGAITDALYDGAGERIFLLSDRLIELDMAELKEMRTLELPFKPDMLAADWDTDSIYISLPIYGRVLQIDLQAWAVSRTFDSVP